MTGFAVVVSAAARRDPDFAAAVLATLGAGARVAREGEAVLAAGPMASGPATSAGGAIGVGEILLTDRKSLVSALAQQGHAASDDDPDLVLLMAAWDAWGPGLLSHVTGEFAFVIWDARERRLFVARDPFGVRPAYYARTVDGFVAASTIAAVRAQRGVRTAIDRSSVVDFLRFGHISDVSATTFSDIRRLPGGHLLETTAAQSAPAVRRWWEFPDPRPHRAAAPDELVDRLRGAATEAVADRVGQRASAILLSGGIDSSGLAAAARIAGPGLAITAFTFDAEPGTRDEDTRFAREVAAALGLAHVIVAPSPAPMTDLASDVWDTPEPFDHPDLPWWRATATRIAAVSSRVIVGEDGDALFRPPSLARTAQAMGWWRTIADLASFVASRRRKPHSGMRLRRRLLRRNVAPPVRWVRAAADDASRAGGGGESGYLRGEARAALTHPVWARFLEGFAPEYSRAALQPTFPLLDLRIVELAMALPPIPHLQQRDAWRRAWRDLLPASVVARPKTPPLGTIASLVTRWRRATPVIPRLGDRVAEFVDTKVVDGILRNGADAEVADAWRAVQLDRWLRSLP